MVEVQESAISTLSEQELTDLFIEKSEYFSSDDWGLVDMLGLMSLGRAKIFLSNGEEGSFNFSDQTNRLMFKVLKRSRRYSCHLVQMIEPESDDMSFRLVNRQGQIAMREEEDDWSEPVWDCNGTFDEAKQLYPHFVLETWH